MTTFTPPLVDGPNRVGDPDDPSWEYFKFFGSWAAGVTVWRDAQGVWHESVVPYAGGATDTVHDAFGPTSTTGAPDEGLGTAQAVYLGGHVYQVSDAEAAALEAAGYELNTSDVHLGWDQNSAEQLAGFEELVMSVDGAHVAAAPVVESSKVVFRLSAGSGSSTSNLRSFWLHDDTEGWGDIEVEAPLVVDPPVFGIDAGGPGVNVIPQMGICLRAGFDADTNKIRGITLNNNVFLGLPGWNVGVWQANPDGTGFANRQGGFAFTETPPMPYGMTCRLVGNTVTVSVFPASNGPGDRSNTKVINLDTDAGSTVGFPTPVAHPTFKAGIISAHLGFHPLPACRLGPLTFRRLS